MNKFLRGLLAVHTLGISEAVIRGKERSEEEQRRRNSYFTYNDYIREAEFESIVMSEVKMIKRITKCVISGPVIKCTVRSQSGISDWCFEIDFNDYGLLTGRYWINSYGNYDSSIPKNLSERISSAVRERGYL